MMSDGTPQTPILMYHAISDLARPTFARYAVPPELFGRHMDAVAASGREPLTVRAYASRLARGDPPNHAVVITFDDAFTDFYTQALPVLTRLGLTATLFVPTAFVGGTSDWLEREGETERRILDWAELRSVVAAGVEIGSHSQHHPQLDRIPATRLREELARSKEQLEDELDVPVSSLAYPFGFHDPKVRRMARDCGYAAACQVGHRKSTLSDDPYALTRLLVPPSQDAGALATMLARREPRLGRLVRVSREAGANALRHLSARARLPGG